MYKDLVGQPIEIGYTVVHIGNTGSSGIRGKIVEVLGFTDKGRVRVETSTGVIHTYNPDRLVVIDRG